MRITHLIRSDGWAGVERHVAALAHQQSIEGHDVVVIGGDQGRMADWLVDGSVQHRAAATVWEGIRALRGRRPDVLHVHMTAAEVAAALSPSTYGVPIVTTRHFAGPRGSNRLSRTVAAVCARRLDRQIAVSDYVAGIVEGPSVVVHAGVEERADARPAGDRERVVLVAQRLEAEKHTDDALRAFAGSRLADLDWRLEIAGAGSLDHELHRLAEDLGVAAAVDFLGHRADIIALMERAGLLLATRIDEAYGLSVVEAMSVGLPVVAAGAGGHLETLGPVEGAALYPPRDHAAASRLVRSLAQDPALRDAYGVALQASQRQRLTLSAQSAATTAVYQEALDG